MAGGAGAVVRRPAVAVVGSYLALSVVLYHRAWTGGPSDTVQIYSGDLMTYVWGLRWVPYALGNGENPFFTDFVNPPDGVNLLNNTGPVLLGVLAAPITLAFGSIASYNVLQTIALAASATSMYVLLRRWTSWRPAAYVGGLLYGFSPYMISSGWSHLPLMFAALPPLIVLCGDELLVRQKGSPWRWGIALGLLVTAQFFSSSEMLADTAELCVLGTLVLAVAYRRQVRARLRHAVTGLATATGLASVLLAYPIWFAVAGPQHARIDVPATLFSGDLLGPVVPTANQVLSPASLQELGDRLDGYVIEYLGRSYAMTARGYIGLPLLLALLFLVVRYRRVALVRFFAVMTAVAFVASLGPVLKVASHVTDIPLPARVLTRVPLLEATSPDRYTLFVGMGVAVLFAVGLDRLRRDLPARVRVLGSRTAALGALVAVCLVPLVPPPYTMVDVVRPAYFERSVRDRVPAGSVLLSYPFPGPLTAEAMEWQAHADMHYRIAGGYQFVPDGTGGATLEGNAGAIAIQLVELHRDGEVPEVTPELEAEMRAELREWEVATVVVVLAAPRSSDVVELFTRLLERDPVVEDGAAVWYDLPSGATS